MRIALPFPLPFKALIKYCDAFSKSANDASFQHITTDSREALRGDLFFSLERDEKKSFAYIKEASEKGAKTIAEASCADFLVADCEKALLKLAGAYKSLLKSLKATIAVTGSVGKTTTKDFVSAMLSASYKTHKTYMNYNNAIGLSLSLLTAPPDTEILILELGMNAIGEISELSQAIRPDFGIITNIGSAHIGKLGSRELIAKAKLEIKDGMNRDMIIAPYEEPLLSSAELKFSIKNSKAEYYLSKVADTEHRFYHNGQMILSFSSSYKSSHHLTAMLIALTLGDILSQGREDLLSGIRNCEKLELRQKLINFKHFSVFDDTYSSSLEAIRADVEYIKLEYHDRPFSLALGDMLELGQYTQVLHNKIGALAYKEGARLLFAFGSYAYLIRDGARSGGMQDSDIYSFTDADFHKSVAKAIYEKSVEGEIVLIKASHSLHSEKIIEEIERLDKDAG